MIANPLWCICFIRPRICPEGEVVTPEPKARTCDIKGNISCSGKRIYRLPGSRSYDKTVIDERSGERMFCSEAEGQAAGWRASRSR